VLPGNRKNDYSILLFYIISCSNIWIQYAIKQLASLGQLDLFEKISSAPALFRGTSVQCSRRASSGYATLLKAGWQKMCFFLMIPVFILYSEVFQVFGNMNGMLASAFSLKTTLCVCVCTCVSCLHVVCVCMKISSINNSGLLLLVLNASVFAIIFP
jgi:hypothetical protein